MEQDNKNKQIFDIVKNALEAAHELHKAKMEAAPTQAALLSNDRDKMIVAISECALKNEKFINSTSFITGRWVARISGFYDDKSMEYIRNDLEFSITIIYLKTAIKFGLTEVIKKALNKKLGINKLVLDGFSWNI